MNSGSFFLAEIKRITASFRPGSSISVSISVTKPCVYAPLMYSPTGSMGSTGVAWVFIEKSAVSIVRYRGHRAKIMFGRSQEEGRELLSGPRADTGGILDLNLPVRSYESRYKADHCSASCEFK